MYGVAIWLRFISLCNQMKAKPKKKVSLGFDDFFGGILGCSLGFKWLFIGNIDFSERFEMFFNI